MSTNLQKTRKRVCPGFPVSGALQGGSMRNGSKLCDSDSKKPGWAADQRSGCQQVDLIPQHGS